MNCFLLAVLFVLFSLSVIVAQSISYYTFESVEAVASLTSCNCVVFRMDDIQDVFVDEAQIAAMNLFISKDQPLSLGLIMNEIGNDLRITGKVGEGSQKGLFELGLHGWDHVDYTKLSESEQESTLQSANEKMKKIFGNTSDIFIEPYGYFNNDTLKAMERLGIRISSAALFSENNFNQGKDIFNYTAKQIAGINNNDSSTASNSTLTADIDPLVYHVPATVSFKGYENSKPSKVSVNNILSTVDDNIKNYGYSVIVFHPQDFMFMDENGRISNDALNQTEFQDFSQLVDTIIDKDIRITTLSDIVGIEPKSYSYFRQIMQNSS
jgi:peptidoglycan/xylan/chitin deacetylase (PgdA/CDA1 family)